MLLLAAHHLAASGLAGLFPHPGQVAIPNPPPRPRPRRSTTKLTQIIGFAKYAALISAGITFFVGLAVFGAGRVLDHRRAGSTGGLMMASSVLIAILFAGGPEVIQALAQ